MVETAELKNDTLEKEGWQRRSILDEPRLSECVAMYEEMGLEVKVVALDLDWATGCKACIEGKADGLKVVYTRPKGPGGVE